MESAEEDEKDTVDFQIAPGLRQFVEYGVQSLQGVTDSKGKAVDPSKPLDKGAVIPHVVSASLDEILPPAPPQATGGGGHLRQAVGAGQEGHCFEGSPYAQDPLGSHPGRIQEGNGHWFLPGVDVEGVENHWCTGQN